MLDKFLYQKKYQKEYRKNHKEELSAYHKKYRENHKEEIKEYNKNHKEEISAKNKEYRKNHREELSAYQKEYKKEYQREHYKNDIQYKLAVVLRSRLYDAIKNNFKSGSAVRNLGCSITYLKTHLETQFLPGMTWKNYGNKERQWSIDHIKPLSSFDLTDRKQFLIACNYKNLRPLWHIENIKKGKNRAS